MSCRGSRPTTGKRRGGRGPPVSPPAAGGRVAPDDREAAGGTRHRVLDQRARETEPPPAVQRGAHGRARFDAGGDRVADTDPLQHVERRPVNPPQLGLGQRLVASALEPGPDRPLRLLERCRPQRPARLAPAPPAAEPTVHPPPPIMIHRLTTPARSAAVEHPSRWSVPQLAISPSAYP